MDHGQKVTGFTGARLYYPPRSDHEYGDYVNGVESDGAWDFTIPTGVLSAGRVGCNLAFIDGDGETYSRNVVFLVEPAVSGVYDPGDGQQTRLDKVIGTVQTAADTAIDNINQTVDDAMESIGKAEQSINESVTAARASADAAANSEQQASASAAKASETNAVSSATAAKASETNAASSASAAASSETNAAASATAAQQAVDGFGLEVGTTTTGNSGTDAAVEIQKTGTKYTANFTIPRGNVGPAGVNENVPLGSTSGVVAHATDAYPALPRKVKVHGATSGGNSVEPTKLISANKNLVPADKLNIFNNNNYIQANDFYIPIGIGLNITFSRYFGDAAIIMEDGTRYGITTIKQAFTVTHGTGKVKQIYGFVSTDGDANLDTDFIQITVGDDTEYSPGVVTEINLPTGISLADGDTLTINRDGTTQIVHAEGEPTVLENVTLPELPVPTFNVYTTGGSVPSTVDVDYEQDVNLVLEAMEAKIAALEVNQTIMKQGA